MRGKALLPGDYRARIKLDWGDGSEQVELPFAVTRKNIEQSFGSEGVAKLPDGGGESGGSGLLLPIAGLVLALLLGVGASVLYFRRLRRRMEQRILRRSEVLAAAREERPPVDEPRFTQDERQGQRSRAKSER